MVNTTYRYLHSKIYERLSAFPAVLKVVRYTLHMSQALFDQVSPSGRNKRIRTSAKLVESVLDQCQVQPWFKQTYRERGSRWDIWRTCFWIEENCPKDISLLEVGCGAGLNLIWFAEQGFQNLYGCDIDMRAITAGETIARQTKREVNFWVSDGLAPAIIPSNQFSVVLNLNWIYLIQGFQLGTFIDCYLPYISTDGILIFDVIDDSYNQSPNNQYMAADLYKPVDQRRPSEYKLRMSREAIDLILKFRNLEIVKVISKPQLVPKLVFIVRKL